MTTTEPPDIPDPQGYPDPQIEPSTTPPPPNLGDQRVAEGKTVNDVVKENAFHRAGVDVTSPVGRLLLNGYMGALEIDDIRTAATEVGIWKPTAEPGEGEELHERQSLANEGEPPVTGPGTGPHPHEKALRAGQTVAMAGGTEEEAMAAAFTSMVIDAAQGDTRGLVHTQPPAR